MSFDPLFKTYRNDAPGVTTTQAGEVPVANGLPVTWTRAPVVRFTVKGYTPEFALAAKTSVPPELAATDLIPEATDTGDPDTEVKAPLVPTVYSDKEPPPLLATKTNF